jgi:dethiobiotin synthetase/adenosylmethionine--8-amino-7-oxononanoate aminotransferase
MKSYVGQEAKAIEQHGIASDISEIFNESRKHSGWLYRKYENYIKDTLKSLTQKGHKFGALLLEPVILGAGGMIFCDPLFQRALIDVIRSNPHLIQKAAPEAVKSDQSHQLAEPWSGLPIVFDEVFTGLYRLGHFNANELIHAKPDIVVNAKLLTGGLLPLCTTTASAEVFDAFLGDGKPEALLHGHSYTAHAVGCQVALESLRTMKKMQNDKFWIEQFGGSWVLGSPKGSNNTWSAWDKNLVGSVAEHQDVQGVVALGTVLALTLKDKHGGGTLSSELTFH